MKENNELEQSDIAIDRVIARKIREEYDQTPQEFCEEACGEIEIGGII